MLHFLSFRPTNAQYWTWTVDAHGQADFNKIQEATDDANIGDSVFVRSGTHYENVVVNKTVSLVGEGVSTTIIDGSSTGHIIHVVSNNVNVTGFTVQKSGNLHWPALDAGICRSIDSGYPSGGNYWSDYHGTDLFCGGYQNGTGSDGIGDSPYIINADYKDNYPLINPWAPQTLRTDINRDGTVNILDITYVAKAFGSKQGNPTWNDAADLDKNNLVNILDISMVAKDYGKTV